jgi:nucleotide-binding universal stress UspA family protein
MKILIAYDGSEFADGAIDDLRNAGLPGSAEALVFTVADVFLPPASEGDGPDEITPEPAAVRRAHERAERKLKEAQSLAKEASARVQQDFPEWNISHEAVAESPAWAIVFKAAEWQADLIVVGSHGQSGLAGRLILGSVSQRVLYEAHCSVRIARRSGTRDRLRLIIGIDGSEHSAAAVEAVSKRKWPAGTEVRLFTAVDTVMAFEGSELEPAEVKWIEVGDESNWDQVREIFEPQAQKLRAVGLTAEVVIKRGHPTQELLDATQSWEAHGLFLGAKGMRGIERLVLGSVSAAVSARAHCSVEVVRPAVKIALPAS